MKGKRGKRLTRKLSEKEEMVLKAQEVLARLACRLPWSSQATFNRTRRVRHGPKSRQSLNRRTSLWQIKADLEEAGIPCNVHLLLIVDLASPRTPTLQRFNSLGLIETFPSGENPVWRARPRNLVSGYLMAYPPVMM